MSASPPDLLGILKNAVPVAFTGTISLEEFEQVKDGRFGDPSSKWDLDYQAPWLCLWRGIPGYGTCVFVIKVTVEDNRIRFTETYGDSEFIQCLGGDIVCLVKQLIDDHCCLPPPQDLQIRKGACWKNGFRVAIYTNYGGVELLSPAEARDFSKRLTELADDIERTKVPN